MSELYRDFIDRKADQIITDLGGAITPAPTNAELYRDFLGRKFDDVIAALNGSITPAPAGDELYRDFIERKFDDVITGIGGYVPPVSFPTVSGSICSFNSAVAGLPLKSHTVALTATQSGSGTPSPDNVRPISGYSAIHIGSDTKYAGFINFNQLLPTAYKDFTNTVTDTRNFYLVFRKSISPYTSLIATSITNTGLFQTIISARFDGDARFLHSGSQNNITITPSNAISVINGHKYFVSMLMEGINTSAVGGLVISDIFIIDLTAMFGSTKADEIYNMEQQTAGSGVAYFRSLFPNDYYDYNAGTLTTVSAANGSTNSFFTIPIGQTVNEGEYNARTGVLEVTQPSVQTIQLPPCPIDTLQGLNNIFADTGDTTLQYIKIGGNT